MKYYSFFYGLYIDSTLIEMSESTVIVFFINTVKSGVYIHTGCMCIYYKRVYIPIVRCKVVTGVCIHHLKKV